jgi:hypothetical protein
MQAGLGGNPNAKSGSRGARRRAGRLCVVGCGHCACVRFTCRLSELHLPATGARGSVSISTRAATLSGAQDKQRTNDGLATAAAVVIFWPAAFFVGGDKQTAAELSQMKGQMVAVVQASIAKKCNIQFQGKPEGT